MSLLSFVVMVNVACSVSLQVSIHRLTGTCSETLQATLTLPWFIVYNLTQLLQLSLALRLEICYTFYLVEISYYRHRVYKLITLALSVLFLSNIVFSEHNFEHDQIKLDISPATTVVTPPNEHWIEWDSPEGLFRQETSQFKANLFKLLRFYEAQIRGTYCGVATAVVALNALAIKAPASQYLGKYRLFTQEEFFEGSIGEAVNKDVVKTKGLTLKDMTALMETQPLKVDPFEAVNLTDDEIRHHIISALQNPNQVVIVLYQRKELKQEGSGHWSPIAAYDCHSDSFLVLDVARYKYPPAWINADTLLASMRIPDDEGLSRGFIILDNKVEE